MADPLTQNDVHVIQNAANVFEALKRAGAVAEEALAIQQAFSDQRRQLDEGAAEIAKRKAEALALAARGVQEQEAFQAQCRSYETAVEEQRRILANLRDQHAALLKAQEQEAAEARSALRREHAAAVEAHQTEIAELAARKRALEEWLEAGEAGIAALRGRRS